MTSISDLPECCICHILSRTTPRDVCRLSAVSSSFWSAADSDYVWERMLPPDLRAVFSRAVSRITSSSFSSPKELFFHLCSSPILIDYGLRSFFLDRASGKKCFTLSARDLIISWSEDEDSWSWVSNFPDSRFSDVAELLRIWSLEIRGAIETSELSPNTWYAAYFILKHNERSSGFDQHPVELALVCEGDDDDDAQVSRRETFIRPISRQNAYLQRWLASRGQMEQPAPNGLRPRDDGWMEVEIGEFYVNGGEDGGEAEFSLLEVKACHMKKGLVFEGIEIRPKTRAPR